MRRAVLALLLACLLGARQSAPRDASALYPCARSAKVVRFFGLDADSPDVPKLNAALAELGAELAYGPRSTSGRPGHAFLAVRAPREASAKKLAAAVKKGGGAVAELECLAFDGRSGQDHDFGLGGLGVTKRDFVMGMAGDVVWYDAYGPWSQIYGPPGKLDARKLAERYEKLYAPYGGAKLGEIVRERFVWTLGSAPDEKQRARVQKLLEKVPGVESATIEGTTLGVTIALNGLEVSADAGTLAAAAGASGEPLDDAGKQAPRAAFDAGGVYELLAAEKLVP